jgi:hypothetical protein
VCPKCAKTFLTLNEGWSHTCTVCSNLAPQERKVQAFTAFSNQHCYLIFDFRISIVSFTLCVYFSTCHFNFKPGFLICYTHIVSTHCITVSCSSLPGYSMLLWPTVTGVIDLRDSGLLSIYQSHQKTEWPIGCSMIVAVVFILLPVFRRLWVH